MPDTKLVCDTTAFRPEVRRATNSRDYINADLFSYLPPVPVTTEETVEDKVIIHLDDNTYEITPLNTPRQIIEIELPVGYSYGNGDQKLIRDLVNTVAKGQTKQALRILNQLDQAHIDPDKAWDWTDNYKVVKDRHPLFKAVDRVLKRWNSTSTKV